MIHTYRAKVMDRNEWAFGIPLPSKFGCGFMINMKKVIDADFYYSCYTMPFDTTTPINEKTIGCSTGLKDMEDNCIYEDDILIDKSQYWLVYYNQEKCSFLLKDLNNNNNGQDDTLDSSYAKRIKIVGNKFDNPELL